MSATSLLVLDTFQRPTPTGVVGELYIGGQGLARGYHGRPGLTAERFVPNPEATGERIYRTGDLARRRRDGNLEVLGRTDHQVKIRGVRIEPSEIEAVLERHPAVRGAVVVARPGAGGLDELVAYVETGGLPGLRAELDDLVRRALPEAFVPSAYVVLEAFPLTPARKVDRARLPSPVAMRRARARYIAPGTPTQQAIAAIWRDILGVDRVGLDDDFFELGGHSLLLGRARAQLEAAFARTFAMRDLFQYPTVRDLAAFVSNERPSAIDPRAEDEASLRKGRERLRERRRTRSRGES